MTKTFFDIRTIAAVLLAIMLLPDVASAQVFDLTKTVNTDTASVGDTLTWQLTFTNNEPFDVREVIIIDQFPATATYISGSAGPNAQYYPDLGFIVWTIPIVGTGESIDLSLSGIVDTTALSPRHVSNFALIGSADELIRDSAVTVIDSLGDPSRMSFSVNKTASRTEAYGLDTIDYNITVSNNSANLTAPQGITLVDTIPQGLTLIRIGGDHNPNYNIVNQAITWTFPQLAPGATEQVHYTVVVDTPVVDTTVATNVAIYGTPNAAFSDSATVMLLPDTLVEPYIPTLTIDKSVDSAQVVAGNDLTYTLTVTNVDTVAADTIVVRDTIPTFTTFISSSDPTATNVAGNILTWTFTTLGAGETRSLDFTVTVDDTVTVGTEITNYGYIEAPDTVYSDTVLTSIVDAPVPSLTIDKAVDSLQVTAGSFMAYQLTVTNTDSFTADSVVVIDTLPTLTRLTSFQPSAGIGYDAATNKLTWTLTNLAASESRTVTLNVRIDSAAPVGAMLRNYAIVVKPDTIFSDTVITIVEQRTGSPDDLEIIKTVSSPTAFAGDTLEYSIVVRNTGDDPILAISWDDVIASQLVYVANSATGNVAFDASLNRLSWDWANLNGGDSVTVTFDAVIDPATTPGTDIHNRAVIQSPDLIPGNDVVTVVQAGEFTLVKNADKSLVLPRDSVTFTLNYTNITGPILTNVVITDTLPAGLTYIQGTATIGSFDPTGRIFTTSPMNIPAGGNGSISFSVRVADDIADGITISNTAHAGGDNLLPTSSNTVNLTTSVPGLDIRKVASLAVAQPGDTIVYGITILNTGSSAVGDILLGDDLPADLELVAGSVTVDGAAVDPSQAFPLVIPVGSIAAGATSFVQYRAVVLESANDNDFIDNIAAAAGSDISGNQVATPVATASVLVNRPRLDITKSVDRTRVRIGSVLRYTITVTNTSTETVDDVTIVDQMPIGFLYVDGSSMLDGASFTDPTGQNPYEWNIGDLDAGETAVLNYSVVIGSSARAGSSDNVAFARGGVFTVIRRTPRAVATVDVMTADIDGAIRGRVIIDCNGDGIPDSDIHPGGIDVYLDDGAKSRSNDSGMFYFNPVRAGERLATLDVRDLGAYTLADREEASRFVYVHEGGESYITWRVCPDYPHLAIDKQIAAVPQVKLTKTAILDRDATLDSTNAVLDYVLRIEKLDGYSVAIEILDSLPTEIRLEGVDTARASIRDWLVDFSNAAFDSAFTYRLHDLAPGTREYLTNRAFLRNLSRDLPPSWTSISDPATVSAGAFRRVPVEEMTLNLVGAYFESGRAELLPQSQAILEQLADSLRRYSDAEVHLAGHTDYRPINTPEFPSNWELSRARARSVYDWFAESAGIDPARMNYDGYASVVPVDTGHTPEAWSKNRRVEVILLQDAAIIDLDNIGDGTWSNWTSLPLPPTVFDTVAAVPDSIMPGLNDLWMITLTIRNSGPGAVDSAVLSDMLPDGVTYVDASAHVNDLPVGASVDEDGRLGIVLPTVDDGEEVTVRYFIRASGDQIPSLGGAAEITIGHPQLESVTQRSNDISFR